MERVMVAVLETQLAPDVDMEIEKILTSRWPAQFHFTLSTSGRSVRTTEIERQLRYLGLTERVVIDREAAGRRALPRVEYRGQEYSGDRIYPILDELARLKAEREG
jgi:hypothetical protein